VLYRRRAGARIQGSRAEVDRRIAFDTAV
jgi:hypothetical protein